MYILNLKGDFNNMIRIFGIKRELFHDEKTRERIKKQATEPGGFHPLTAVFSYEEYSERGSFHTLLPAKYLNDPFYLDGFTEQAAKEFTEYYGTDFIYFTSKEEVLKFLESNN